MAWGAGVTIALVTAAQSDPVTTAEAKTHMRVDFSTDDSYIAGLIAKATAFAQHQTHRQFVSATFRQSWDTVPSALEPRDPSRYLPGLFVPSEANVVGVKLGREPVTAVSWVKYYDATDTLQTVSGSDYWTDLDSSPPRIVPKTSWPVVHPQRPNAFQVQFVAGYGDASAVPALLKHAILMLVSHWYEHREPVVTGTVVTPVPMAVESILLQFEAGRLP